MAGDEADVVAEREETFTNRAHQVAVVPSGKVSAADRAPEEHVAHLGQAARCVEEDNVAWRVTWAVNDGEVHVSQADAVTFGEPAIGHKGLNIGKAKHLTLRGDRPEQELVVPMGSLDRQPESSG